MQKEIWIREALLSVIVFLILLILQCVLFNGSIYDRYGQQTVPYTVCEVLQSLNGQKAWYQ